MHPRFVIFGLLAAHLAACTPESPKTPAASEVPPVASAPGSDRDAHGCIGSAGYSWCAATNQCERPFELSKTRGLAETKEAFDEFCKNPAQ